MKINSLQIDYFFSTKQRLLLSFCCIQAIIIGIVITLYPAIMTYYNSSACFKGETINTSVSKMIDTYYYFMGILVYGFTAFIFVIFWERLVALEKNVLIQKLTQNKPLHKLGILWMILAFICWQVESVIELIKPLQLLNKVYLSYANRFIGVFNTSCFVLAMHYIEFHIPPKWLEWKPIKILNNSTLFLSIPFVYTLSYVLIDNYLPNYVVYCPYFELSYTVLGLSVLGVFLGAMFRDRKLGAMNSLLFFVLGLILITQIVLRLTTLSDPLIPIFEYHFLLYKLLTLTFPILLIILILAWAYTWVDFYMNKALNVLNNELMETNAALAAEKDRQIMLRAEMNHTNRGNLRNLLYDLSKLDIEPATNEALKNETIARIQHIYTLHSLLHDEQNSETHISLHTYIEKLIQTLKQSHKWTQFEYEIKGQDMLLNNKTLRDLGSIILEAAINAYKAYSNTQRKPNLWIKLSTENSYLQIEIIDEAGGIPVSAPTNFGSKQLAYLAEDLEGSIKTYNNDRSGATVAFQVEKEKLSIIRSNFSTNHQ